MDDLLTTAAARFLFSDISFFCDDGDSSVSRWTTQHRFLGALGLSRFLLSSCVGGRRPRKVREARLDPDPARLHPLVGPPPRCGQVATRDSPRFPEIIRARFGA